MVDDVVANGEIELFVQRPKLGLVVNIPRISFSMVQEQIVIMLIEWIEGNPGRCRKIFDHPKRAAAQFKSRLSNEFASRPPRPVEGRHHEMLLV